MSFTPLSAFTCAAANNVTGPAIVVSPRAGIETFLVTGGATPMVCLLNGEQTGEGFEASLAANWKGLAFGGIEFHVDMDSKVPYAQSGAAPGSIVVHDSGADIFIKVKTAHGFKETRRYPLADRGDSSDRHEDVTFSRWKAFQRRDGELHEVFSFPAVEESAL